MEKRGNNVLLLPERQCGREGSLNEALYGVQSLSHELPINNKLSQNLQFSLEICRMDLATPWENTKGMGPCLVCPCLVLLF